MGAANYLVETLDQDQGNIKVERAGYTITTVRLYGNPILRRNTQIAPGEQPYETVILDVCDKPTVTTARAMNRGLKQWGFPGEVTQVESKDRLVYWNGDDAYVLDGLVELTKDGYVTEIGA